MNLHSLRNSKGARHSKSRLGRGRSSGRGKTSGRGGKGQMARAGSHHKLAFEGGQMPLFRRLPKRGFTHLKDVVHAPVNVGDLSKFDDGAEITFDLLRKSGMVKGRIGGVKILGGGTLEKKLTVKAQAFSAAAREKIEKAGGTCEVTA